jgi:hypothetical protein
MSHSDPSLDVAVWFLVIGLWIILILKAVKLCIHCFQKEDLKSIFAGYERVHMEDRDPLAPM